MLTGAVFRSTLKFVAAVACAMALSAQAQDYPSRQIEFVVPYGPGGSTDAFVRVLAPRLSEALNTPVVIVNRPGAAAVIGSNYAMATKDGYRILAAGSTNLGTALTAGPKPAYAIEDVTAISQVLMNQMVLVTKPGRFASFDAFLKEAREKPDTVTVGSWGLRTLSHFYVEQLSQALDVKLRHIPYDSGSKEMVAAMAGEVDVAIVTAASAKTNILAGTVTGLFISTEQKASDLPNVESIKTLGYPAAVASSFEGIAVNAKTAPERIAVLRQAFAKIQADPQVAAAIRATGSEPAYLPGPAYDERLRTNLASLRQIAAKVRMDD
ncbi:tripartite tricarboxylate transporter substrate binding protein [Xylophilus sp. GOD-11R]|uniref:Bug family tripartite tricarboxylate transporter substrate binding protein n=1 Tax=Xylophilus sp. GOD-11R TaxID=3089814 RepID=UPI00298C6B51|nr:tripartite tricarboxylate transporter substrate binding protein [Xylophilus sp. GOD-11R]WPB55597.1 tripartite tricarboxylate transporter substrate binding protein [Xylophilus sp. GOD-11R]